MSTYQQGIKDAIDYLNGSTFSHDDMRVVGNVLALLRAFDAQGGYSKWQRPEENAITPAMVKAVTDRLSEAMGFFDLRIPAREICKAVLEAQRSPLKE